MSTPKGMRNRAFTLESGNQVMVYSDDNKLILQLRREVPTTTDILAPSFKVAVDLNPKEAINLATELLNEAVLKIQKDVG